MRGGLLNMIDYKNTELLKCTMAGLVALAKTLENNQSNNIEIVTDPNLIIHTYDDQGNKLQAHLAFDLKMTIEQFVINFRITPDSWWHVDNPPKTPKEYFGK